MDTIKIFYNPHSRTRVINNSKGIWKATKKDNSTIYTADYNGFYYTYKPDDYYVAVKFSVTKTLYGKNIETLDTKDIKLLNIIIDLYNKELLNNAPAATDWSVNRLDLPFNYLCKNEKDALTYIDLIKQLRFTRYKSSGDFLTSVHMHNKSMTHNHYIKHYQDNTVSASILRIEFQLKNPALNRLVKNGKLKSKKFGDIMSNLKELNIIYKEKLDSLGLGYKFLSKPQMENFLAQLLKKKKISKTVYNNISSNLSKWNRKDSHEVLYKYKGFFAKHGIHYIISERQLTNNIDFYDFYLYQNKITKPKNSFKIHTLLFLFVMPSILTSFLSSIISKSIILFNITSIKIFFDDS